MTIEGAIVDLQNLIDNDGIPFWAKPSLQKVMETVEAEREEHLWIPVTERLPDKEGYYLASKKDTIGCRGYLDVVYWLGTEWATFSIVTAWMPLPKPYEEGAE